jgi:hypothetical protein
MDGAKILPTISWGGGPPEGWWRGLCAGLATYPSTMLRMVPLPSKCWGGFK